MHYAYIFDQLLLRKRVGKRNNPTDIFAVLEPKNTRIDVFGLIDIHRSAELEAPKLSKGRSGFPVDFRPTEPLTILEPRNQSIGEFYPIQKRRTLIQMFAGIGRVTFTYSQK